MENPGYLVVALIMAGTFALTWRKALEELRGERTPREFKDSDSAIAKMYLRTGPIATFGWLLWIPFLTGEAFGLSDAGSAGSAIVVALLAPVLLGLVLFASVGLFGVPRRLVPPHARI